MTKPCRILCGAASLLVLAALSGCAAATEPITDSEYFDRFSGLSSYDTYLATDKGKDLLVGLSTGFCESLEERKDQGERSHFVELYAAMAQDGGGDSADARQFAQASIDRYCPEMTID